MKVYKILYIAMVLLKEKLKEIQTENIKKEVKVGIIGAGYVGLVTAAGLAYKGYNVLLVEKDKEKLKKIKQGICPFYEPDLQRYLLEGIESGRLSFRENISELVSECRYIFVCVGTPIKDDSTYDMYYLDIVAKEIANNLKNDFRIIIIRSTVPPGTGRWFKKAILRYRRGVKANFEVVSMPEFLREGNAIYDFFNPSRIIIGSDNYDIGKEVSELYSDFGAPILIVSLEEAEIIKLASNAFLAMRISFINSIANLAEVFDSNIENIRLGIGLDPRIGTEFLKAGIGFGGSCLPKDLSALISVFNNYQINPILFEAVKIINDERIDIFINKIKKALWNIKNKILTVWGVSFKANTDDIRESPALKIIPKLVQEGAFINVYDPKGLHNFQSYIQKNYPHFSNSIKLIENIYESTVNSSAILITNDWDEYKRVNYYNIYELMETPIIIDGRNIVNPLEMREIGFEYYSIGNNIK